MLKLKHLPPFCTFIVSVNFFHFSLNLMDSISPDVTGATDKCEQNFSANLKHCNEGKRKSDGSIKCDKLRSD